MAEQFDFEEEYESESDTLAGAPPRQIVDEEAAVKRHMYRSHRIMTNPDGSPVIQAEPAQAKLEREARIAAERQRRAAQRVAAAKVAPPPVAQEEEEQETEEEAMDAVVADLTADRPRSLEATLTEAERRFDKAKYYKLLLSAPLINDASPAGQEVEEELRTFAQERFEIFLGMRSERPPPGAVPAVFQAWEPEDFKVLHDLIRSIRARAGGIPTPPAPRPEPSITPLGASAPTPAPAVPSIRPVQAQPAPAAAAQPPAPAPAPKKKRAPAAAGVTKVGKRLVKPLVNPMDGKPVLNPFTGQQVMKDITQQVPPPPGGVQPIPMPTDPAQITMLHESKANEAAAMASAALAKAGKSGMKLRVAIAHSQLTGSDGRLAYEGSEYVPDVASMMTEPGDER